MKNKKMEFYSLLDFYPRKEFLRGNFENLSNDEKSIYKMYVYSLCWETEYIKDLIWEYLNGWKESQFELGRQYRLKLNKVRKLK